MLNGVFLVLAASLTSTMPTVEGLSNVLTPGGVRGLSLQGASPLLLLALRLGALLFASVAIRDALPGARGVIPLLLIALSALLTLTAGFPLVLYVGIWTGFLVLRNRATLIGLPDQGAVIAALDRRLGGGIAPTLRLQHLAAGTAWKETLDQLAIGVHASYFVLPHVVAVILWAWRPNSFRLLLGIEFAVMLVAVTLHALAPTSPPWLQERPAGVRRIVEGGKVDQGSENAPVYHLVTDRNPRAAFPSLHLALTLSVALVLWRVSPWLGLLGGLYTLAMGCSLVLMGEHYLVDVLAGAAITLLSYRLVTPLL